jgi:hypothetical protein
LHQQQPALGMKLANSWYSVQLAQDLCLKNKRLMERNLEAEIKKILIALYQGARISFGGQPRNYQTAVEQLVDILGDEEPAANHLSKCILQLGMGSNDYLNNYFMPTVYSSRQYNPQQYADVLINQYSQQIRVRV